MAQRPNILLIMTDQHRADWIGASGTGFVDTPHIDALARRGVRFARAGCSSPVCAPSRAALASGLLPHRLGVLHNKINFPPDCPTYFQALRKSGYRVGVVGKTDLHKADHDYGDGDLPLMYHFGFTDPHETEGKGNAARPRLEQYSEDSFALAGPYQQYLREHGLLDRYLADMQSRKRFPTWHTAPSCLPAEHFHDSYIGRSACELLERMPADRPWHLFVSFVGPHHPWDAPAAYVQRYADKAYPPSIRDAMPEAGKPAWIRQRAAKQSFGLTTAAEMEVKRYYAAAIALIDDWVGAMTTILERRGLDENTVVIFCSDHGEMLGDHGLLLKTLMYEGALRIPLIIADPRRPEAGVSEALVELFDLHPTILDLAGVDYAPAKLDSRSLQPLLTGEAHEIKPFQVSLLDNCRMICDERYKLIASYNDRAELYNLSDDAEELHNRMEAEPEIAAALMKQLKAACK